MNPWAILTYFPMLLGLFAAEPAAMQGVTRVVVQDEVIIRIPVQPRPYDRPVEWVEHKAPNCIPIAAIRGALLSGPEQVDFLFGNGSRVRAKLDEDCPALDFYAGFYLQPRDQHLCVGRDAIHSRMGGSCRIEAFRQLIPRFRR